MGNDQGLSMRPWLVWVDRFGPLIGLMVVVILFTILVGGQFLQPSNLELVARQTAIVGIAAMGMTLVIVCGGIDLSVGAIVALSTVIVALLLRAGVGPLGAACGGVMAGFLCGGVSGWLVTRFRVVPFIVTLGMMLVVRGIAKGLAGDEKSGLCQTMSYDWRGERSFGHRPTGEITVELWRCQQCGSERVYGIAPIYFSGFRPE